MCNTATSTAQCISRTDDYRIADAICKGYGFFKVCVKFITPLIMVLILYGQIKEFFL